MSMREDDARLAVGKMVQHRKKRSMYRVEKAIKEEVYLRALSPRSRSTWKWIAHLWLDYEEPNAALGSSPEEKK